MLFRSKNGENKFRPDITLLINGLPLAFAEVKKPNNRDGILAERDRINVRFKNKKFRKFINISQILVFSNNMEYDSESIEPIQGAFYSSTSYQDANFNCFREEEKFDLAVLLKPEDDAVENFVLRDNNLSVIKQTPEFLTCKEPNTPEGAHIFARIRGYISTLKKQNINIFQQLANVLSRKTLVPICAKWLQKFLVQIMMIF